MSVGALKHLVGHWLRYCLEIIISVVLVWVSMPIFQFKMGGLLVFFENFRWWYFFWGVNRQDIFLFKKYVLLLLGLDFSLILSQKNRVANCFCSQVF